MKYIEITKEKYRFERIELQKKNQTVDEMIEEESKDEHKNIQQQLIESQSKELSEIRKIINRMLHSMGGSDKDSAIQACNYAIEFEQFHGDSKSLMKRINKRNEIIEMKEKQEANN